MPRAEQTTLLPEQRPEGVLMNVELDEIETLPDFDPNGLVDSIRRLGVLQPVALIQVRNRAGRSHETRHLYEVAEGRRRVIAMRQIADEASREGVHVGAVIPALVFPRGTPRHVAAAMALSANMHRAPNVLNEFDEIQQLVRDGWPEDEIAHELRLPVNTIRARMRLGALIEPLRDRLARREMSPSTAQAAARLSRELQSQIVENAASEPRVTARHIRAVREVRDEQTAEQFQDIFEAPERVDGDIRPIDSRVRLEAQPVPHGPVVAHANGETIRIEIALPEGVDAVPNGWEHVVAYLTAAEMAIPASPDDDTDWVFQTLAELRERVDAIAGVTASS